MNLTEDCFVATPEKIVAAANENTIGVVAILGTTYSGHFEDVAGIDAAIGARPIGHHQTSCFCGTCGMLPLLGQQAWELATTDACCVSPGL